MNLCVVGILFHQAFTSNTYILSVLTQAQHHVNCYSYICGWEGAGLELSFFHEQKWTKTYPPVTCYEAESLHRCLINSYIIGLPINLKIMI